MIEVCFVCLGNICRSPLAQGVFEKLVVQKKTFRIVSRSPPPAPGAGTSGRRRTSACRKRPNKYGVQLNSRGQQFQSADFFSLDLILAMDHSNLSILEQLCPDPKKAENLKLFRSFDPESNGDLNVPDPYYGGGKGFEIVYEIVDRTCPKILEFVKNRAGLIP